MTAKADAKLKKVFTAHLPIDESSSRSIQRVVALYLGHTVTKIDPQVLREVCSDLGLFDYEGGGKKKENNFGANFTQNMKKDVALFDGDHSTGWKLTAAGKAEAKSIFEDGNAPTKRRVEGGSKPKAPAKKASPKPAGTKATGKKSGGKKPAAPKKPSGKKATGSDEERRKAAKRRLAKKRDLSAAPASGNGGQPAETPAPASAEGKLP